MLPGRFGVGTYSPIALALVGCSVLACGRGLATAGPSSRPGGSRGRRRQALIVIVALYLGLSVATLQWVHPEREDVYIFQRDAAAALLHGVDPYSITHRNLYVHDFSFFYGPGVVKNNRVEIGCPYPPLGLLAILPGYLLGDLRYSYLTMLIFSGLLLARMGRSPLTAAAVALFLLSPVTLFVLSRSFTEPLVILMLYCTCLAAERRSRWLPVALGALFASKQYAVLGAPFAGWLLARFTWKNYLRLLAQSAAVAALVTIPFALWNWHDFWRDVVMFQIIQPFRPDALSVSVFAVRLGLPQIPQALVILAVFAVIAWCLRVTRPGPAAFPGCVALVLLCFFALNKQAFVNYYFLVIGAVLLAAVLPDAPAPPTTTCIAAPATRLQT